MSRHRQVLHLLGRVFRHRLGGFLRAGGGTGIWSVGRAVGILPVAKYYAAHAYAGRSHLNLQHGDGWREERNRASVEPGSHQVQSPNICPTKIENLKHHNKKTRKELIKINELNCASCKIKVQNFLDKRIHFIIPFKKKRQSNANLRPTFGVATHKEMRTKCVLCFSQKPVKHLSSIFPPFSVTEHSIHGRLVNENS